MRSLASSFLSSETTVVEYDLKQAKGMQAGLLFNMCFMWFLHFKMEQIQPLLIQSMMGISSMVYSPLFQVYIMGRNLERPFKTQGMPKLEEQASESGEDADTSAEATIDEKTEDDNEEDDDEVSDGEDSEDDEESESSDESDEDEED